MFLSIMGFSNVGANCDSAYTVNSLPFNLSASSDSTGNNYTNICGSSYSSQNDFVFAYTPSSDQYVDITLTNTSVYVGLFVTLGCPDTGSCVNYNESALGNPLLNNVYLQSGNTYYIIVSNDDQSGFGLFPSTNFTININEVPPFDANVLQITSPQSNCYLTNSEIISCDIENKGADSLYNFLISYKINGGTPVNETIYDTILPGDTLNYSFSTTADFLNSGNYNLVVYTSVIGDTNNINDTINAVISNTPEYVSFPYSNDFETSPTWWTPSGTNSSWQLGTPAATIINSAASGTNAWVTNLTGNHNAETSYLVSPCFSFLTLNKPRIEFSLWYETQQYLSTLSFEYSIDNGNTWLPLSAGSANQNWSTAWSGSSGGWINVSNTVPALANMPSVKFRFTFNALQANNEGVAIDDINISNCSLGDPIADFTYTLSGQHVDFTNTSTGATSYIWNFGDLQTSTDTNPSHDYINFSYTYTVTLIAQNDCGSDTITYDIIVVGLDNDKAFKNITIYPNPTNKFVEIKSKNAQIQNIEIYDIYGKKLNNITTNKAKQSNKLKLDISSLQKGIYFIKIQTTQGNIVKKIIKN